MTIAILLWPTAGTNAATYVTPALVALGVICIRRLDREQGR